MDPPSNTSFSMLQGVQVQDPTQWERFSRLYSPLVVQWCRRFGISESDSPDVAQDVFRTVASRAADFRHDRPGDTFQGWLWTITRSRSMDHFRRLAKQPVGHGGSTANVQLNQVPDHLADECDTETFETDRQTIYTQALRLLETEFETHTWQAFVKTAVEGQAAKDVASELSMTAGAVYNARYKVLRRLRDEFDGMIDIDL